MSIHTMLAAMTDVKEFNLMKEEADLLLKASNDVARHYASGALNQKYVDWAHLMGVVGAVYGSRFMAYKYRMAAKAARDVTPNSNAKPQAAPSSAADMTKTAADDLAMQTALHSMTQ